MVDDLDGGGSDFRAREGGRTETGKKEMVWVRRWVFFFFNLYKKFKFTHLPSNTLVNIWLDHGLLVNKWLK